MSQQVITISDQQLEKYLHQHEGYIASEIERYHGRNLYAEGNSKIRRSLIGDIFYILDEARAHADNNLLWFDCVYNRYRHLGRMPKVTAREVVDLLLANEADLAKQEDFDSLYNIIRQLTTEAHVAKIGAVAWYDIALRIGLVLHDNIFLPDKQLYLHADVKTAAKGVMMKSTRARMGYRIATADYQKLFVGMKSTYIEDFLCDLQRIYVPRDFGMEIPCRFIREGNPSLSLNWDKNLSLESVIAERY